MWNLQEQQHEKLEKAREGTMVERGWKLFNSIFYMGSFSYPCPAIIQVRKCGKQNCKSARATWIEGCLILSVDRCCHKKNNMKYTSFLIQAMKQREELTWSDAKSRRKITHRQRAWWKFHVRLISVNHFWCHSASCMHCANTEHSFLLVAIHDEVTELECRVTE